MKRYETIPRHLVKYRGDEILRRIKERHRMSHLKLIETDLDKQDQKEAAQDRKEK